MTDAMTDALLSVLQSLGAGDQCRTDLETSTQHLLSLLAQPILDRIPIEQGSDYKTKYSSEYNVTQDAFLYDHNKVWHHYMCMPYETAQRQLSHLCHGTVPVSVRCINDMHANLATSS